MTFHTIKSNLKAPEGVRRDVLDGQESLIVPVVMIVDGVLNGALVTQQEYGKYVEAWNGRPVPVLHPERDGMPVSANQPDIISRSTIGQIFNARIDSGKLKAEAWINTDKANRLGYSDLMDQLEAGEIIEVSTGYYSDAESSQGEFDGEPYTEIHRNIRPDHLALLPGEVGACSVMDGCGTRVNKDQSIMSKTRDAFSTIANALGFSVNCKCKEPDMDLLNRAEELHANEAISAKQLKMLQEMDPEQRAMFRALMDSMSESPDEEPEEMEQGDDPEENDAPVNQSRSAELPDVDALVANKVAEHIRRHEVTGKLVANERCPFDADELKAMSIDHLEKLEKSIRPSDYSGRGGFAANSDAVDTESSPLTIHRGVLSAKEQ